MALRDGMLFGMGNPLLDVQAVVDKAFLDKWGLEQNNAILCEDKHIPMFEELSKLSTVTYIPGGATQNSLRVAAWMLGKPNVITFTGCVGNDKYGETLSEKMSSAGVKTLYQIDPKTKTGTCAVCIFDVYRSLGAHLAAANCFTIDHLEKPEQWSQVEKAQFYYISGFFLTVCPEGMEKVGKHACEKNKCFMMNLSAPFLCEFFKTQMMTVMPYVDILFGNESEAKTFAKAQGWETEKVSEIAEKMSQLPKENSKRNRLVIITQGEDPTIVAENGKSTQFPINPLSADKIVDTNGAGDSFVGGFLSQMLQGKPMEERIRGGNWAATTMIQQSGCSLPPSCDFK